MAIVNPLYGAQAALNRARKFGSPAGVRSAYTILFLLLAFGLTGCTVWGAKNPPTFKSMTGAQDHEHVFWSQVKAQQWRKVHAMLAPNVVYSADGKVLSRDQIVPYLQAEKISDFILTSVQVKPNGPDMTLTYHLQISSPGGRTRSLSAISVWQQLGSGWILIVHTEQKAAS